MTRSGLPHSDIVGLQAASASPTLFAGNHVLHRLLVPRHPPYALHNLTEIFLDTHRSAPCAWSEGASIQHWTKKKYLIVACFDRSRGLCMSAEADTTTGGTRPKTSSDCQRTNKRKSQGNCFTCSLFLFPCLVELRGIEPLTPSLQS